MPMRLNFLLFKTTPERYPTPIEVPTGWYHSADACITVPMRLNFLLFNTAHERYPTPIELPTEAYHSAHASKLSFVQHIT